MDCAAHVKEAMADFAPSMVAGHRNATTPARKAVCWGPRRCAPTKARVGPRSLCLDCETLVIHSRESAISVALDDEWAAKLPGWGSPRVTAGD